MFKSWANLAFFLRPGGSIGIVEGNFLMIIFLPTLVLRKIHEFLAIILKKFLLMPDRKHKSPGYVYLLQYHRDEIKNKDETQLQFFKTVV